MTEIPNNNFDLFLEESINKIITSRPDNPYDELIYQLYMKMSPEMHSKNPALHRFGQSFKSQLKNEKQNN